MNIIMIAFRLCRVIGNLPQYITIDQCSLDLLLMLLSVYILLLAFVFALFNFPMMSFLLIFSSIYLYFLVIWIKLQ